MDAQALVLGADEDGAEEVAAHEEQEEAVMQPGVAVRVEDAEEDEAGGAAHGADDAQHAEDLLRDAEVFRQAARVAEPALRGEGEVEEDGRDDGAGDEERLEPVGAHVGDVGDALVGFHGGVARAALREPDDEHGEEHAWDGGNQRLVLCYRVTGCEESIPYRTT